MPEKTPHHVSYRAARAFLEKCSRRPERMRLLCSKSATRCGGDNIIVSVEISEGGPVVKVREVSMRDGWTGCRFSPSALWLALTVASSNRYGVYRRDCEQDEGRVPCALELGCGVGLVGMAAHAVGFRATLTDCLPKQLQSLSEMCGGDTSSPRVFQLDWIKQHGGAIDADAGSPENAGNVRTDCTATSSFAASLPAAENRSFDLVLASDVLYEPHHAQLLPLVIERWLKPGGWWALAFAIRDADMLVDFIDRLQPAGILDVEEELVCDRGGPECCYLSWETCCVVGQCEACRDAHRDRDAGSNLLGILRQTIRTHEGGAIMLHGRRPPWEPC